MYADAVHPLVALGFMKLVVKSKLRRELLAVKFIKSEGVTVVII